MKDGSYGFNLLSELSLTASRELKLIDPKINIRVDKDTPDEVYTMCSELTKVGLGFPQYSNDDVVIPGLIKLGYAPEDAVEYTVRSFRGPPASAECSQCRYFEGCTGLP